MQEFDMKEKIAHLYLWCEQNNINAKNIEKVFNMLKLGKRPDWSPGHPVQYPGCYIHDTNAQPWHAPQDYWWTDLLEANYEAIKTEAINVFEKQQAIHPDNDNLAYNGTWNTFFFYKNGAQYDDNHTQCPITSNVLAQIPGIEIAGRTYFSAMTPGIHIMPHCGPHNFKLRTHLGLVVPKGATIRVGEIEKPWEEGKCIVFDDSFTHEVWNRSDSNRIVLIVDVWNPCLLPEEIQALIYIMPEFYKRGAA